MNYIFPSIFSPHFASTNQSYFKMKNYPFVIINIKLFFELDRVFQWQILKHVKPFISLHKLIFTRKEIDIVIYYYITYKGILTSNNSFAFYIKNTFYFFSLFYSLTKNYFIDSILYLWGNNNIWSVYGKKSIS